DGERVVEGVEGVEREQRQDEETSTGKEGEQGDRRGNNTSDFPASPGPAGAMQMGLMGVAEPLNAKEEPSNADTGDPLPPPVLVAPNASSTDWLKYIAYVAVAGVVGLIIYIDRAYQKRVVPKFWRRNTHVTGRHIVLVVSLMMRGVFILGVAILAAAVFTRTETLLNVSEKMILFFVGFVVFSGAYAALLDLHERLVDSSLFEAQRSSPNRYMTFHALATIVLMGFLYVLWGKGKVEHGSAVATCSKTTVV
ncbi:MAG: hypothetical protein ABEI52_08050, partial [Halobacteriaceae archaeon]